MPLNKSCSVDAFKGNIRKEYENSKNQKQAVAIAFSTLKSACGVTSKKRMKPEEIVAAKKTESAMFDAIYSLLENLRTLSEQTLTPRQRHLLNRRKEELMDELVLRVRKSYKWQKVKTHERLASKQVRGDNVIDVHKHVLKTPYGKFDVEMWEGPLTMKKRVMVYRILMDGKETAYNEQRSVRAAKDVVEKLVAKRMLQDVWPEEKAKILA